MMFGQILSPAGKSSPCCHKSIEHTIEHYPWVSQAASPTKAICILAISKIKLTIIKRTGEYSNISCTNYRRLNNIYNKQTHMGRNSNMPLQKTICFCWAHNHRIKTKLVFKKPSEFKMNDNRALPELLFFKRSLIDMNYSFVTCNN